MKKYCIINGDDYGASAGINRGIVEAHRDGILTSASLMVDMPGAAEAAELSRSIPDMSVGIHVVLTEENGTPVIDFSAADQCRAELDRQWERFIELMGMPPTHLDAHHNIHRDPLLEPHFVEWAARHKLPLREHSPVKYFSNFYGQWDGETHPEQIDVASICKMFATEVDTGYTELACHPGYVDPGFQTGYSTERELELRTICDPRVRQALNQLHIELISYKHFNKLQTDALVRSA